MERQFRALLTTIEALRPGYRATLGAGCDAARIQRALGGQRVPDLIHAIYTHVCGTVREIQDQRFMDLVPGYRLLQLDEIPGRIAEIQAHHGSLASQRIIPILGDYASNYFCLRVSDSADEIVSIVHDDDEIDVVYASSSTFLDTVAECYEAGAYFLDEDGFLDCDDEREEAIGRAHNPGCDYWED